ncbi:chorion peroxidase isoform X1 [Drosophila miranda]|uniref:chorion peroxidase isoform X1 n=2 Tax=Drosophila miranda TaxID=7229 RepID=UPI0007E738F6|nr:chorion peroxidase isoform X1 [Drosophila miranda]
MCLTIYLCMLTVVIGTSASSLTNRLELTHPRQALRPDVQAHLDGLSSEKWQELVSSGLDSINRQKRLEENLLRSDITVRNGSLSHVQLLDTLPNNASKEDSEIALKILKASLFVYNTQCLPHEIEGDECRTYLENKPLPEGSVLRSECLKLLKSKRYGHHSYRRLLVHHYKNGFYEIFTEDRLPAAWSISMGLYEPDNIQKVKQARDQANGDLNLGIAQWAQFVEHDLSKPVSQSMSNGSPIECCNRDQNKLQPRHNHPACAPIISQVSGKYGRPNCLNYVRSALAVGPTCNFGGAEQLNQATAYLDLSQLYGFTPIAERKMRTFVRGTLKSTSNGAHLNDLLPMTADTDDKGHSFCAWGASANATCFAAGDSRVNSNPYSILVYTIFMRNHNRLAAELLERNPDWSDEQLFQSAKTVNVDIYRRVIMREWLPEVLGSRLASEVLATSPPISRQNAPEISNEFGVAASRFYFSMLPNELHNLVKNGDDDYVRNKVLPPTNLFVLKDEIFRPRLQYTAKKLDEILHSVLNQRAMKMDSSYAGDVVWHESTKPTHADILAFDVQRGRDHGLQPYYKYLELCSHIKQVTGWSDFEQFIPKNVLNKLKNIYASWTDVDLIVGGIAERPLNGTVGATFSCILSEQFAKVHQRHLQDPDLPPWAASLLEEYRYMNGSKLLCLNSELRATPQNIFQLPSASNLLIDCDNVV